MVKRQTLKKNIDIPHSRLRLKLSRLRDLNSIDGKKIFLNTLFIAWADKAFYIDRPSVIPLFVSILNLYSRDITFDGDIMINVHPIVLEINLNNELCTICEFIVSNIQNTFLESFFCTLS